jgi:pimeloyl-ACP methyl ester carboxylesterase
MQHLPLKKFYCNQEVACRFLRAPAKNEVLVLTIPGGPCLSGLYLDQFLMTLAKRSYILVNVGIIDLPNHGESVMAEGSSQLSYQRCVEMINTVLQEVRNECGMMVLFGQSFGARVAFDLLATSDVQIDGAVLTGFPAEFQMSSDLMKMIGELELELSTLENEDEVFLRNWSKILNLYTYAPLPENVFNALASNLKRSGNENILDNVPAFASTAKKLKSKSRISPLAVIQGDVDGVVPDNNLSMLKANLPLAQFYEFKNCGHFPMVEQEEETLKVFTEFLSKVV